MATHSSILAWRIPWTEAPRPAVPCLNQAHTGPGLERDVSQTSLCVLDQPGLQPAIQAGPRLGPGLPFLLTSVLGSPGTRHPWSATQGPGPPLFEQQDVGVCWPPRARGSDGRLTWGPGAAL